MYHLTDVFTIVYVLVFAGVGIGVDFWLRSKFGEPGTISAETAVWSRVYPLIPFLYGAAFGLLAGHFFWPNFAYCH